jgi:Flp pilus assembly protein TadD
MFYGEFVFMQSIYPLLAVGFFVTVALSGCSHGRMPSRWWADDTKTAQDVLTLRQSQKFQQALKEAERLVADAPSSENLLLYADTLRYAGQAKQALAVYQSMPNDDLTKPLDQAEGEALCLLDLGEVNTAGVAFTKILAKDAMRWRSTNALGVILALQGRPKEANHYFDLSREAGGDAITIENNRGLAMSLLGKHPQAIKALKAAVLAAGPEHRLLSKLEMNLAMVLGVAGKFDEAKMLAGHYLKGADIDHNMAVYALLAGQPEKAKAFLQQALLSSQSNPSLAHTPSWKLYESIEESKKTP